LRALLAFLLLHANELISSDRLIDEVWGPDPPKTAGASLQNYVSRLRKAIGPELIVSQPSGYVLRVDPQHFDLARFERLVAEARSSPLRERAEKLRAALALWRGRALEDLAFEPFIRDEAGRMEETRLAALEERIEADLGLGAGNELVTELEALVEEHPLRERFRGQLMLALYRGGRQAEALESYQDTRRVLMDELGLEPSEELRALQQAILQQDPSLVAREVRATGRPPDRRTVTVLFCDLVDSTKLAAELDPEAYRRLMSRYFELVRAPIERHGGTLEKFIGDAVMAVFGVPEIHEDDAFRAVRAAEEAQAALRDEVWDVPLAARIGLSTGEVHVLSSPGDDLNVSGAAASAAARLEERAPAGGILLSTETHRLVRDAIRGDPVDGAWRLDEVLAEAAPFARRLDAPLVGRNTELERIRSAYEHARAGKQCCVVTLVGEAGIGKTRLARELVTSLRDEARVLVGRCVSYGEGATYLPIAEIVRQAAGENTLTGIRKLLESEDDAEAVALRVAEVTGIAESPAAPGEAPWAIRRLLEALARTGPVLLVFDDIHWAEPTLLDLFEYLGEWAEGPIFVVCLARRELLESRPAWGGPASTGFLVELEPLPAEVLGVLVERLAAKPIEARLEQRIVQHSGGNPLFAEQLLAFAGDAPEVALESPPPNLEALLASRLDRLSPRELALLRRAAVLGRRFTAAELDDLGADPDTCRLLHDLTERRLVRPVQAHFRFHHALVRDVAYRGIPKTGRAELHELAARGLERRGGAEELIGYHFEQAYRCLSEIQQLDDHARELALAGGERLGEAGIRAWKRADVPAAVNLLSRAVDLQPGAHDLACELSLALHVSGDTDRATEILKQVAQAADKRLALRAQIELAYFRSLSEKDRAADLLDAASTAIPVLEAAADDRALGRAWLFVGHVKGGFYCNYASMEDAALRATTHYRRAGWSPSVAAGDVGLALYLGPKHVDAAVDQCERLLRELEGDRATEANVIVWLGGLEAMRGAISKAHAYVARAHDMYLELGLTTAAIDNCGRVLGGIEMLAGAPDNAEEALRRCCELLQAKRHTAVLATRAAELGEAIYAGGNYAEAEIWAKLARDSAGRDDRDALLSWQPLQAMVRARAGAFEEAEQVARNAVELAASTDALNRAANAFTALAEVLYLAGRHDEAANAIDNAIALYDLKGNAAAVRRIRSRLSQGVVTE
jgi:class 3 adenylate cyclase